VKEVLVEDVLGDIVALEIKVKAQCFLKKGARSSRV
jgi:hypothetical protein